MPMRIRCLSYPGDALSYGVERLSDGATFDFATLAFTTGTPTTPLASLPESTAQPGLYKATLSPTPIAQFRDGEYALYFIRAASNLAVSSANAVMYAGDDAPALPIRLAQGVILAATARSFTFSGYFPAPAGAYAGHKLLFGAGTADTRWSDVVLNHTVAGGNPTFTFAADQFVPVAGDYALVMGG